MTYADLAHSRVASRIFTVLGGITNTTYGFKILDTTHHDKDGADAPVHHSGEGYATRDEAWQAMLPAFRDDGASPRTALSSRPWKAPGAATP